MTESIAALKDYTLLEGSSDVADGKHVLPRLDRAAALEALEPYTTGFDSEWGGFGNAPKFPRPVMLHLLARIQARLAKNASTAGEAASARKMMLATLEKMAAGGMHDHLGGGFHRYSVDRFWHVPHFEKMLYDQAQLATAYLEAFQITGDERHSQVVRDILAYVTRDLTAEAGGFFSAEDADSSLSFEHPEQHAEGAFYVWTKDELTRVLTAEESAVFLPHYGVEADGNAPDGSDPQAEFTGKNILIERQDIARTAALAGVPENESATLLESARTKLLAIRGRRPRPHRDDKILTAWNGLMISAFARAYQVLGDAAYLRTARRAADFIRREMYSHDTGKLRRSFREGPAAVDGFADDYAFLIQGLLDLYEAGFDSEHLVWARTLQSKQDKLFLDPHAGGYFGASHHEDSDAAADEPALPLRLKEDHDGAEPARVPFPRSTWAVSPPFSKTKASARAPRRRWRRLRASSRGGQEQTIERLAQVMPAMLGAWDFLAQEPRRLVIAGGAECPDTLALTRVVHARYEPNAVLMLADGGAGQRVLVQGSPYLEGVTTVDGRAAAYVCEGGACQLPVTDPAALSALLGK